MHDTSNIIQNNHSSDFRKEAIKMFHEGDSILLLFTGGINIGKEKWNIVAADKGH
jgi:hypothetical protein